MKVLTQKRFEADNIDELYYFAIDRVLYNPEYVVRPRGMEIHEVLNTQLVLTNPKNCLVHSKARKLNYAFTIMEKLQYLSGDTDSNRLSFYNGNFSNFKNEYDYFDGDYGTRIAYWLEHIYRLLKKDKDSRQAVYTIYGVQDRHSSKDIPCTLSHQFFIRDNKLHMTANMRSNDLLWGFPYDVNGFVFIQEFLAAALGLEMGTYTHNVGSLHIYTERADQLKAVLEDETKLKIENPAIEQGIDFKQYILDVHMLLKIEQMYKMHHDDEAMLLEKMLPTSLLAYLNVLKKKIFEKRDKLEHI